jgi:two-component sensor histidine kinase/DNA-binding NarL/FixJ family response regulator
MSGVLQDRRILLVEDDSIIAIDLRETLEKAGAIVVGPARTVEKALALANSNAIDAAVLDIRLESGDTLRLAKLLTDRRIPVIFQTSDPSLVSGRVRHLPLLRKPLAKTQLVTAVEQLLRNSGTRSPSNAIVEQAPEPQAPGDQGVTVRIHQQEILAELGVMALRGPALTELLNETVRLAADGLQAEFCKVLEYLPLENRLLMRAGVGWHPGLVGHASVGADLASPSGYALHTGRPVISNHLASEERFRTPELLAEHGVRRAINVILQGDGNPYGVLEVDSRSEGEFTEHDIAFLQGAANILGMAIERQRIERKLKEALEHQQVLVKEINHRVKNSLQLVASMLNLQAGEDASIAQRLQDASSRITAIARAHDRLYRSPQIDKIELGQYLKDVCADFAEVMPHCDVVCEAGAQILMATDRAIRLALLVTELVTNAAKHAYPDGKEGRIWVRARRVDQTLVQILVRDEGAGLAADFDWRQTSTLGMRLVAALAEQSQVSVDVRRLPKGCEFVIDVPTHQI